MERSLRDLHRAVEVDVPSDEADQLEPQDDGKGRHHRPSEGTHGANDNIAEEPDDTGEGPGPLRGGPVPFVLPLLELPDEEGVVSEPLGNKQGDKRQHYGRSPAGGTVEEAVAHRDRQGSHP